MRTFIRIVEAADDSPIKSTVDRFHNEALPIYHARMTGARVPLHRRGDAHEYSEFTHDPTGSGRPGRMNGGRGSGFASGQYAYQTPHPDTQQVNGPHHPLIVTKPPHEFQRNAINMMRAAQQIADGTVDLAEPRPIERLMKDVKYDYVDRAGDISGYAGDHLRLTMYDMTKFKPPGVDWTQAQRDVVDACIAWGAHRHVHPMNILLSRWGYDGIMWGGAAAKDGDNGDYGAVTFPPITQHGEVVGLVPRNHTYMELHPDLRT